MGMFLKRGTLFKKSLQQVLQGIFQRKTLVPRERAAPRVLLALTNFQWDEMDSWQCHDEKSMGDGRFCYGHLRKCDLPHLLIIKEMETQQGCSCIFPVNNN